MTWSKEKWHFGRDSTRSARMMKWQEPHLHAPLTTALDRVADREHVAATTAKVIHAFDTVQKFMGQRNTRNMDLRLNEMLHYAVSVPEVRDEVYIAVIKQSTDNKDEPDGRLSPQGPTARGFELIALCLCAFPPSQQFEDYLEHYVREPQFKTYSEQYNLPGLLRRRMYHGEVLLSFMGHLHHLNVHCLLTPPKLTSDTSPLFFSSFFPPNFLVIIPFDRCHYCYRGAVAI